jgi:hypothetical protein
MEAIEIRSKTDKNGHLKIDFPLFKKEKEVRILILFEEDIDDQEKDSSWLQAISHNPAFAFLHEPDENIYSLKDGKPFDD